MKKLFRKMGTIFAVVIMSAGLILAVTPANALGSSGNDKPYMPIEDCVEYKQLNVSAVSLSVVVRDHCSIEEGICFPLAISKKSLPCLMWAT